jgi:hypothetical protein
VHKIAQSGHPAKLLRQEDSCSMHRKFSFRRILRQNFVTCWVTDKCLSLTKKFQSKGSKLWPTVWTIECCCYTPNKYYVSVDFKK